MPVRAKTRIPHHIHTYEAAEPRPRPPGPAATPLPRRHRHRGSGSPVRSSQPQGGALTAAPCASPGRSSPTLCRVIMTSRRVASATAAEEGQGVMAAVPAPSSGALLPVAAEAGAVVRSREAVRPAAKRPKKILDEDAYIEVGGGPGTPRSESPRPLAARPVPNGRGQRGVLTRSRDFLFAEFREYYSARFLSRRGEVTGAKGVSGS